MAIEQLKGEADKDILKLFFEMKNNDGFKVLFLAAQKQRQDLVRYLIENFYPELNKPIQIECDAIKNMILCFKQMNEGILDYTKSLQMNRYITFNTLR